MRTTMVVRCRNQFAFVRSVSDYGLKQSDICETSKNEATWCMRLGHFDGE